MKNQEGGRAVGATEAKLVLEKMPTAWAATEVSTEDASRIGIRGDKILGIAASGVTDGSTLKMYGRDVVMGLTVLRHEEAATRLAGEGAANVDHYVLVHNHNGPACFEYTLYGPFLGTTESSNNAGLPHWPSESEFCDFVDGVDNAS
jgi:hypothetical protein